jgi:cytochrome oxidase Cu insertion factor (SCO1/SenC/PrrC family)
MSRTAKIVLLYTFVALFSAAILATAFWVRSGFPSRKVNAELAIGQGRETEKTWFPIEKDFPAIDQEGAAVKLSDLRGKVFVVAEFFAVCPHCAVRNGAELTAIYNEFKSNPDFHIVCVSVDPAEDKPEKLKNYAKVLSADVKNWWFLNGGEPKAVHDYLEKELKFFGVRERTDPLEIEANGRYSHDLGFLLVDKDFNVIGKWPLADARSDEAKKADPGLYDRLKQDLFARIRTELAKQANP